MQTRKLGLILALALAAPAAAQESVVNRLNGQPVKVGTLTSAGTSISNASTATPFTIVAGQIYLVQCAGASHLVFDGATASATITDATYGVKLSSGEYFIWRALSTSMSMIPVSGSTNCAVWRMT